MRVARAGHARPMLRTLILAAALLLVTGPAASAQDVVGEAVKLTRAGRNLKGLCPFHSEKTPSFVVYPNDGSYHCFGCGASGDAFAFLMKTEGLDFRGSLEKLAGRAGVELKPRNEEAAVETTRYHWDMTRRSKRPMLLDSL